MRIATEYGVAAALLLALAAVTPCSARCTVITQVVQCSDLACDEATGLCVPCTSDANCYPSRMICTSAGTCRVAPLVSKFSMGVVLSMLGAVVVCAIGVIAGVGGGGILVPMFNILLHTPLITSVGLSQCTICGQSLVNVALNASKKHPGPDVHRPLVNYQYLSLLLPLGIVGTLIGGLLNKVCPDWVRLLLLFVLLTTVLYRSARKMVKQYRIDRNIKEQQHRSAMVESIDSPPHIGDVGEIRTSVPPKSPTGATPESQVPESPRVKAPSASAQVETPQYLRNQEQFPLYEIRCMLASFFIMLVFNVLRSTTTRCGSVAYILCIVLPTLMILAIFAGSWLHNQRLFLSGGAGALTFPWNRNTSVYFLLVAIVAGAGAAMLGIGGGLVLGFVLYEAGMVPQEASSTSGVATLLLATESALQLLAQHHLELDYGLAFSLCGMMSAGIGQFCLMPLIKLHGLLFLIVASLSFIVLGSLIILSGYGIYSSVVLVRAGGSLLAFGAFCVDRE